MTRIEKLRKMSAEELAELMVKSEDEAPYCREQYCPYWQEDGTCPGWQAEGDAACKAACVNYLNGEAEEAEGK